MIYNKNDLLTMHTYGQPAPVVIVEDTSHGINWVKIVAVLVALAIIGVIVFSFVLPALGINVRKNLTGGGETMVTYNTMVKISNHWILDPSIDYISSSRTAAATLSGVSENYQPVLNIGLDEDFWFVFEVYAPDGSKQRWEKMSHCPNSVFGIWGGHAEENFVWGTTYRGTHTLRASIHDPNAHSIVWNTKVVTLEVT